MCAIYGPIKLNHPMYNIGLDISLWSVKVLKYLPINTQNEWNAKIIYLKFQAYVSEWDAKINIINETSYYFYCQQYFTLAEMVLGSRYYCPFSLLACFWKMD